MPITYRVDQDAHLIRATLHGDVTMEEMLDCVSSAAAEVGEPGYGILSDHRDIGEPITRPQVERLVSQLEALRAAFAGARWAAVVSKPASFGMMRMLAVLAESIPMTVRVFVDAARAERWALGASDPDLDAGDALPPPR